MWRTFPSTFGAAEKERESRASFMTALSNFRHNRSALEAPLPISSLWVPQTMRMEEFNEVPGLKPKLTRVCFELHRRNRARLTRYHTTFTCAAFGLHECGRVGLSTMEI